ncbi:ABC transporter substrate-binding protein [Tropicimonas sp. IMCC34043]|uniref:ABC transporter substrate-binding protein n=1 Tax=Tropicimonas sp. IMCC34043 TaxID=2248760 RepID=UPI000E252A4C|nr:ABC transporter substrate-binding protein [Tropicimonas sp. IMCC34043]
MKLHTKLLAGVTALMLCAMGQAQAETVTIVSWGGAYGAVQKKYMIDPWVEATGNEVLFEDYPGGIAEMKAQVEAGNIQWDAVDIEAIDLERACSEGYLEVLDMGDLPPGDDGTPAAEDFIPVAIANECGVGVIVWSVIYAYDKAAEGPAPTSIADFFDTEKFPGKRALRKRPQVNLEWALMADGVPMDEVYDVLATDEGQARAFAKLDTIKDDIVWFDSWSQAPQLLNDGGAAMVQSANGRIYAAIADDGKPFEIVWDGQVYDIDVWSILKGTAKKDVVWDFIKFATSSKPLAGMIDVAYGPTRKSSDAYVDAAITQSLPSAHTDVGIKADGIFWADYGESLGEAFNEWLLQ